MAAHIALNHVNYVIMGFQVHISNAYVSYITLKLHNLLLKCRELFQYAHLYIEQLSVSSSILQTVIAACIPRHNDEQSSYICDIACMMYKLACAVHCTLHEICSFSIVQCVCVQLLCNTNSQYKLQYCYAVELGTHEHIPCFFADLDVSISATITFAVQF